ncbi:MAG: hypothetical protein US52_C0053G0008 [candidate division WS6 bacterium GW2011_GWA2_37_6]|uniref:Uncharacterized protein n=1 Tax=candidate division WS6 bacterium GW2011_GWA2_37_6 TaxID=1619087 RepID=A0A0G0H7U5_9BACT|nr:MAG: hypothetical protein US52_C0053G0008 [candidate division WS6 bacterium GW2011_GWA2_37_6]
MDDNRELFHAADDRVNNRLFAYYFIGVLSCHVDPEVWRECLKLAEENFKS